MDVIKATGDKEPFSEEKLRLSIHRAGVPDSIQNLVVQHIKSKIYDGMPTSEVFHHITEFLSTSSHPYSQAKYRLKQSIMNLGPSGYPFENYVSEILKTKGYTTQVRQILKGRCVTHEIDVIARKGSHKILIEAKFHNMPGTKTNVHVALYTKARFDDIIQQNDYNQVWIITNTKISQDAIVYASCVGMKVIGWNFPEGESLRELVEEANLIPITALSTLSTSNMQQLLTQNIVMSKVLCNNPDLLSILNLTKEKKQQILSELNFVCKIQ